MSTVAFRPVDASGEVVFEELPAGKYAVLVSSPNKPYAVVRASPQGVESPGHELNVTPGVSFDTTVFLAGGVVTVEGFAKRGEKPMAGVMVIRVPRDPESHQEMFRRDQSDLDGSFALPGVIPGVYTIVAVENAWGFEWLEPSVLSRYVQHGQNITIEELMQGSVHLPNPLEVEPPEIRPYPSVASWFLISPSRKIRRPDPNSKSAEHHAEAEPRVVCQKMDRYLEFRIGRKSFGVSSSRIKFNCS